MSNCRRNGRVGGDCLLARKRTLHAKQPTLYEKVVEDQGGKCEIWQGNTEQRKTREKNCKTCFVYVRTYVFFLFLAVQLIYLPSCVLCKKMGFELHARQVLFFSGGGGGSVREFHRPALLCCIEREGGMRAAQERGGRHVLRRL